LLGIHEYMCIRLFRGAALGKVRVPVGLVQVFGLNKVAEIISKASGFEVTPDMFPDLIPVRKPSHC